MNRRDLIFIFERLELYMGSGLTVIGALDELLKGLNKRQRKKVISIGSIVESGGSLSVAFSKHFRLKTALITLIAHAERTGELVQVFGQVRSFLEREDDLYKKCTSALVYPVVIGVFAFGLMLFLVRGILPQIIPMLLGLHATLPSITRLVIDVSSVLTQFGLYIMLVMTVVSVGVWYTYRRSTRFRRLIQNSYPYIPIIGRLIGSYHLSLFLYSLGSLVDAGLPLHTSYGQVTNSLSFWPLQKRALPFVVELEKGMLLSAVFLEFKGIPAYAGALVAAGEKSGSLGKMLTRSSLIVSRDLEQSLKQMTALLEPLLMGGMGGVVGIIAVSIMLPIYDISRVLQH